MQQVARAAHRRYRRQIKIVQHIARKDDEVRCIVCWCVRDVAKDMQSVQSAPRSDNDVHTKNIRNKNLDQRQIGR